MANSEIPESAPAEKTAFLYVIGGEAGPHKVGFSEAPMGRLQTLSMGSPIKLALKHQLEVPWMARKMAEKYAHALLSARHSHGEWFDVTAGQALAALELALAGIQKGRLPPGPSIADSREPHRRKSGEPFGLTSLTPQRALAAKRYSSLLATRTDESAEPEDRAFAGLAIRRIHDAVSSHLTAVGVTLLARVVGAGEPLGSLPGSARQYHIMRDFVFLALDDVFRLTAT